MSHIPMRKIPDGVTVTDNGGPNHGGTHDRFTVTMPDGAVYSMSTNVLADTGVCSFRGGYKPGKNEQECEMIPVHVEQKIKELLV